MNEVPKRGDLVVIDVNPHIGHEQAGNRPAIVLSPQAFNSQTGFTVICPITRQTKGYPFEVKLPEGLGIDGYVLTDQVKNLDWKARNLKIKGQATEEVIKECMDKIHTFLS